MQTPYRADGDGQLRAAMPERCPFARPGDARCDVRLHHHRSRKTGPSMVLAVVGCRTHTAHRFTLYPPAYVPYGRVPVAPVSLSGAVLLDGQSREPAWDNTLFRAAQDLAGGVRWPVDSPSGDVRRRRTQGRHLETGARLLGVHPELHEDVREQIATRLEVATMELRSAAQLWSADPSGSWTARAAALLRVVNVLPVTAGLPGRLLCSGALVGLWPPPRRWDPIRGTLSRSNLPEWATPISPIVRGSPSTNSRSAGL